ncbi:MAG: hemolysin family protein [Pirellulaceae bacterium]
MITVTLLGWAAILGMVLTGQAATAVKVLQEFSRRELELYCQRRKRLDRFGEILDHYEGVTQSLDSLQTFGTVLMLLPGWWCLHLLFFAGSELGLVEFSVAFVVAALVIMATVFWIPWAVARIWSEPLLYHWWPIWYATARCVWPLTWGVIGMDALLRRLANRPKHEEDEEEAFEDEIRSIVTEGMHDGVLEEDAREMIEGVIELADETVSHIMTPRSNIDAFDVRSNWSDVLRFVVEFGRTRIPVYEDRLDNIVGVLYVKDLLRKMSAESDHPNVSLVDILREPWFVPAAKPLDEMLQKFLQTREHLAIVVDEYRSVAGVVTIEDVLEEIVGEIVDESDKDEEELIRKIDETTSEVLGLAHVDMVNQHLGLDLPEPEDCDTLAGFVISDLGRIPKTGEFINTAGARITVLEATRRRIERLRIEITTAPPTSEGLES